MQISPILHPYYSNTNTINKNTSFKRDVTTQKNIDSVKNSSLKDSEKKVMLDAYEKTKDYIDSLDADISLHYKPKDKRKSFSSRKKRSSPEKIKDFFKNAVVCPFKDFMSRPGWTYILLFILLYRLSDAYISPMAYIFYKDMGFGYSQIATVTKIYGTIATIVGMLVGGMLLNKMSLTRGLLLCGILQGLSNLIYVAQTYAGNNLYMLTLTISVENITGGMGTAAFVAYISSLCNVKYTATQYALLSSLMSLARDVLASSSGWLVQHIGWSSFFISTTFMAVPGLLVLWYITRRYPPAVTPSLSETNPSGAKPRR